MHNFFVFALIILCFFSITIVGFSLYVGISPMPSSRKAKRALLALIPETQGKILELGSGWGTLALSIAKKFPQNEIHAYEISPIPWAVSCFIKEFFKQNNLILHRRNFFEVPFQDAEVIVCYLCPKAMQKLKHKFTRELNSHALIISNTFSIYEWKPTEIIDINDLWNSKIYTYKNFR